MENKIINYVGAAIIFILILCVGLFLANQKEMPYGFKWGAQLVSGDSLAPRQACVKSANQTRVEALKKLTSAVNVVDANAIKTRDAAIKSAKTTLTAAKKSTTDPDKISDAKIQYQTSIKAVNVAFSKAIGGKLAKDYITAYNAAEKAYNTAVKSCPK